MSDQQTDMAQDINFDDFNLSEAPHPDTAESQNRDSAPRYDFAAGQQRRKPAR